MRVENKARGGVNFDPVTNADIEAERALRDLIIKHFPDDGIEGEELEDIDGRTDWSWTLDPIDGTRGFVAGVPVWSTLIAISYKDIPVIGMMDFPALGQTYQGISYEDQSCAWRALDSGGLFSIHSRPCAAISDAVLGCTEPLAMLGPGELAAYNIIRRGARFSRLGLDAYGYALAASGRMDIIIEAGLKPCDVRALMPVMKGAGGAMTNWHGGTAAGGGRAVAVGDPGLLPELYTYLGRAMQP
jgi:myo-inositol-1(or 4)-monophosphatase